jgi:Leucine-rich repeat (LRR) protein
MKPAFIGLLALCFFGGGCGDSKEQAAPRTEAKKSEAVPVVAVTIDNPIVENAIRESLKKSTGELPKAEVEKVTKLDLWCNQLAEVSKDLEKLTQLMFLTLGNNRLTDVKSLEKLDQLE